MQLTQDRQPLEEIRLDLAAQIPLYEQIAEQIKQLIATNRLKPGEHLPTVRELAKALNINPGTVARAYSELERAQIVVSRRGGGTLVSAKAKDPLVVMLRQRRLSSLASDSILEALSLGYSPEEVEAAFHVHLARWREERKSIAEILAKEDKREKSPNTILIVGSHDLALDLLVGQLKQRDTEVSVKIIHAGSLAGLIALQEERADMAGIHLLDEETGEYNYPYIKHILPGRELAIVHLAYRIQGLMFAKNNPKQIEGFEDLRRTDITFVNRQKGSGTRVLLDLQLRQHGILPSEIKGYERAADTHLAVARNIAKGEADVGLGIEAAARASDLGFLPLFRERYDLVVPVERYKSKLLAPLWKIIASYDFRTVVENVGGYDTSQTGETSFFQ